MNGGSNRGGSAWAPLALVTLVILIISSIIYYYYYHYIDNKCVENHLRNKFKDANDDFIKSYLDWELKYTKVLKTGAKCPEDYNDITAPEDTCVICEQKSLPELPVEINDKLKSWGKTPPWARAPSTGSPQAMTA